jgi:glutaconyl-CoA/methylmalonyl-CoA decarboxylase subunit gamma
MKYIVRIADKSFNVEIDDIHTRPVIARVDGNAFEVFPELEGKPEASKQQKGFGLHETSQDSTRQAGKGNILTAPLPGTIIEIFVKNGEEIEAGHVVLVIEAMKMKNSIRSIRAGKVAEVLVSAGQTVTHRQALVRFE